MDPDGKLLGSKVELTLRRPPLPAIDVPQRHFDDYVPVASSQQEKSLRDVWHTILKWKLTILATLVVVVTLVTIATFRMTPQYEGLVRIAINRESSEILGFKEVETTTSDDWDYSVALETQVRILESDAMAARVIQQLALDTKPAFAGKDAHPASATSESLRSGSADRKIENELLHRFHSALHVNIVPRTRIVEIRFLSPDPKLAAEVVNSVANVYVEQNFQTKYESTIQASEWLSKQLVDLRLKVETTQEKLVRYQKEHGILGLDEKQNIITSKLDELNRQLTSAETDRIQKEVLYKLTLTSEPELVAKADSNSLLEKLRVQQAQLKDEYAQATVEYGSSYPKVQKLGNQLRQIDLSIQAEVKRTGARVQADYLAAQQRERMLRAALEAQKAEANKLNESAIQYNILKRDGETSRQLYEGLLQKLKEAGVSAGLRSNNVRIVDSARVPSTPAKPNIPRNIALGILIGLLGGVGLAFVLETLDNTVQTPDQVTTMVALPTLGVIPLTVGSSARLKNGKRRLALPAGGHTQPDAMLAMISHTNPKSQLAESYRALRTSVLLSRPEAPPKVIIVTSALPQEGKTTTSVNIAIVMAQRGGRVLLVDADLRRPGIHKLMRVPSTLGLSTLLTGGAEDGVILPSEVPNLFLVPAGPAPPHPAELLGSVLMKQCIERWREEFDHIIIDTPPMLSVTDAVLLSVEADSIIVVVRSARTTKEAMRHAVDLLRQVNACVAGVVVNAVDLRSPGSHYYSYYSSKYGGKYYDSDL